jgi:DNA processing protein
MAPRDTRAALSVIPFRQRLRDHPPMNPHAVSCWLTLARAPGLGPRGRIALVERFGAVEALFSASHAELRTALLDAALDPAPPDASAGIDALLGGPARDVFASDIAWLAENGHSLLTWLDPDYPPLLREIADPPVVLYVQGDRSLLLRPQLAIVGSRNPTPVGRENAAAFARALTQAGLAVTSGLALGVDAAAHQGALDAGGATIAVAGTGLDRVYPPRNRALAHAIAARGALVSEFTIGTGPRAEHFPRRNRIISGMSLGALVVEAALQSGSLITARLAGEQGREVFALPGSIHSPLARGCHALIRQGAKLVETAEHVLEELGPLARAVAAPMPARTAAILAPMESQLLDCLGYEQLRIDALIERSGLTPDTVSSILLQLELRGLVLAGPAGYQRAP